MEIPVFICMVLNYPTFIRIQNQHFIIKKIVPDPWDENAAFLQKNLMLFLWGKRTRF
jgi:hypothetical protein